MSDRISKHPATDRVLKSQCTCGHDFSDHIVLPGHPDGAEECYGTDDCECGRFVRAPRDIRGMSDEQYWDAMADAQSY